MNYYLSGPMSGLPGYNYAAFDEATRTMRQAGMEVLSPHELDDGSTELGSKTWSQYMRAAVSLLMKADAIVMLRGWGDSKGAIKELEIALSLKMPVFLFKGDPPWPVERID